MKTIDVQIRRNTRRGRVAVWARCNSCGAGLRAQNRYVAVSSRFDVNGMRGVSFRYYCVGCDPVILST